MRILIVEDDIDSSKILSHYLKPFGECDVALDGKQAIESVKMAFEEEQPYDLICMDIMMPNLNGQEALRRIRKIEQDKGITIGQGAKIVMVSALSDHDNIMKSFLRLCDAYIVKPIDREELVNKLKEIELLDS